MLIKSAALIAFAALVGGIAGGETPVEYGVDVSFPIHHSRVSDNYAWLEHNVDPSLPTPKKYQGTPVQPLGDRQAFYEDYIDGCVKYWNARGNKGSRCVATEEARVAMSLRQPQSMQNYTDVGFKKIRAPEAMFKMIKEFWDNNKDKAKEEAWGAGNTYTNNWSAPSKMVSVDDTKLRGGGKLLKRQIWEAARDTIQEWTGQELTDCSLYGIRIYPEGAVLNTHVDRLPLVSSAIINVDQDVDEPWPLEVYTHDGKAVNVTMVPGDMVLYESHSILHGRPFPLKGRYMANIFVHFEPVGHSLRHNTGIGGDKQNVDEKYRDAIARGSGGHEHDNHDGLPPYVLAGSPEESNWRRQHPDGHKSQRRSSSTGSTIAHLAAQDGNIDALKREVDMKKDIVHAKDENGWTPLHEGARAGHVEVAKFLIENGADFNSRTTGRNNGSVLWWAKRTHKDGHPVIDYLESLGALEIGPDL